MADQRELAAYLRSHRSKFTLEQLRAGLIEQGADPAILDAALAEVAADKPAPRSRKALYYALALTVPAFWLVYWLLPRRAAVLAVGAAPAPVAAVTPLDRARASYHENFFDPYTHVDLADALYKAGRLSDAFYVLEEARGLFPAEAFDAAHDYVITCARRGGWPGAGPLDGSPEHENALKTKADADPRDWESRSALAYIAARRGDFAGAEALIDAALALSPDEPGALGLKAQLLLKRKDVDGAMGAFERVFALTTDSPDRRSAIGLMTALASTGAKGGARAKRAAKTLADWAKARPDDADVALARAFVLAAAENLTGVRKLVRDGEKSRPGTTAYDAVKGLLAIQDKKIPEAVALLKGVVARDPGNVYALEKLAQLHRKELGDMAGALPYYIALHRDDPNYYDGEFAEFRIKKELERQRAETVSGAKTAADVAALLKSDDGAVRAEACLAAGRLGDPSLIGALSDALDDEVGNVVQNADEALFELSKSHPKEILAARDAIAGSPRPFVRGMALNLYCDVDKAGMKATALARLSDSSPYVRWRAYAALTGYYRGDSEAATAVAEFLAHERDARLLATLRYVDSKREPR